MLGTQRFAGADHALEQGHQRLFVENAPTEEGVDHHRRPFGALPVDAHQKVTREADPTGWDADATGDLAVDEPQGNGNAQAAIEDVGEQAVLGIVVVGFVAGEPLALVDVMSQLERLRFG